MNSSDHYHDTNHRRPSGSWISKNKCSYNDKDNKETPYAPKYEEIKFTEEQTEKIYKGLRQQTTILLNSKKILGPLGNLKYTTQNAESKKQMNIM